VLGPGVVLGLPPVQLLPGEEGEIRESSFLGRRGRSGSRDEFRPECREGGINLQK
jgi:hypothetical protein